MFGANPTSRNRSRLVETSLTFEASAITCVRQRRSQKINAHAFKTYEYFLQHVDEENSYLCGYLKIKGLTEEFPTLTTFFDGEIISKKYPFLTRKWEADEDVDKKHWVLFILSLCQDTFFTPVFMFV